MMEERLLHAEFKRELQLQAIVKKAQEEEAKVEEGIPLKSSNQMLVPAKLFFFFFLWLKWDVCGHTFFFFTSSVKLHSSTHNVSKKMTAVAWQHVSRLILAKILLLFF